VLLRKGGLQLLSQKVGLTAARLLQCFKQQQVLDDVSRLHIRLLARLAAEAGDGNDMTM
jgi:hypothetical protein